jgi:7-carboxy-7-deazaguanine synthase
MTLSTSDRFPQGRTDDLLALSEVFVSLQGEGPSSGERALFVRLAECNLACTWCDTAYTWDWRIYNRSAEVASVEPNSLAHHLTDLADTSLRLVVLTGGEPMLQQHAGAALLTHLRTARPRLRIEVETNGTIAPHPDFDPLVHRYVVSPKLAHAGGKPTARIRHSVLTDYAQHPASVFKFVVATADDLAEIGAVIKAVGIDRHRVWLMPQATQPDELLARTPAIAELALANGYNLSRRAHLTIWGNARGR